MSIIHLRDTINIEVFRFTPDNSAGIVNGPEDQFYIATSMLFVDPMAVAADPESPILTVMLNKVGKKYEDGSVQEYVPVGAPMICGIHGDAIAVIVHNEKPEAKE